MKSGVGLDLYLQLRQEFSKRSFKLKDIPLLDKNQRKAFMIASLWKPGNILSLLKLLSMQNLAIAGDFFRTILASKALEYSDSRTITFYLP